MSAHQHILDSVHGPPDAGDERRHCDGTGEGKWIRSSHCDGERGHVFGERGGGVERAGDDGVSEQDGSAGGPSRVIKTEGDEIKAMKIQYKETKK